MEQNLASFTSPGCDYPAYVSINQRWDMVQITVRGPRTGDGKCGETTAIMLRPDEFVRLMTDAAEKFRLVFPSI